MSEPFSTSAIEALRRARRVLVITGAGISAESGIPTFRGEGGIWEDAESLTYATASGLSRDIEGAWHWFEKMRCIVARARPNPAHLTLASMEPAYPDFVVITQNVDDLHRTAGSRKLIEIHGNLWRMRCLGNPEHQWEDRACPLPELPPRCPTCGGTARPNVVLFGEEYGHEIDQALAFARREVHAALVIGTSGALGVLRCLLQPAKEGGAHVIEINIKPSEAADLADDRILGRAGEVLPELWARVQSEGKPAMIV